MPSESNRRPAKKPNNSQPQNLAYSNSQLKPPPPPKISSRLPPACAKCANSRLLTNSDRHPECPTCGWINYDWIINPETRTLVDSLRPSVTILHYSGSTPQWKGKTLRLELTETNQRIGVKEKELLLANCPICEIDRPGKRSALTKGLSSKGKPTLMTCSTWKHQIKLIKAKDGAFKSWDN